MTEQSKPATPQHSEQEVHAAQLFLQAFQRSSIDIWIEALKSSENIVIRGDLGTAVMRLRKCWYHDGTPAQRRICHEAAAALKFELQEIGHD